MPVSLRGYPVLSRLRGGQHGCDGWHWGCKLVCGRYGQCRVVKPSGTGISLPSPDYDHHEHQRWIATLRIAFCLARLEKNDRRGECCERMSTGTGALEGNDYVMRIPKTETGKDGGDGHGGQEERKSQGHTKIKYRVPIKNYKVPPLIPVPPTWAGSLPMARNALLVHLNPLLGYG